MGNVEKTISSNDTPSLYSSLYFSAYSPFTSSIPTYPFSPVLSIDFEFSKVLLNIYGRSYNLTAHFGLFLWKNVPIDGL
jgi:hypothetical protein